jgi:hypothetical protein
MDKTQLDELVALQKAYAKIRRETSLVALDSNYIHIDHEAMVELLEAEPNRKQSVKNNGATFSYPVEVTIWHEGVAFIALFDFPAIAEYGLRYLLPRELDHAFEQYLQRQRVGA